MNEPRREVGAPDPLRGEDGHVVFRVLSLVALGLAAVLVGLLLFAGGSGYRLTAVFENGGQIVKGNAVEVGGRPVGTVKGIRLDDHARAVVTFEVSDDRLAPLHDGTTAAIRATSLSGIANRYVSLQPGPNDAPKIPSGGQIDADRASAPVDLDQLFNTFDPRTRRALQRVIQGSATYYAGRGRDAADSLKYLGPAFAATSRLTSEISLDDAVFARFVNDTARTVSAIAERREQLSSLVANANTSAQAIGDENVAFDRSLALLPSTLRKANTTFVNLRSTLDDLDPFVAESRTATRKLTPFLRRLRPLVADARPTIRDLRTLIRAPGKNNDLIELTAKLPGLAKLTHIVFPRTIRAFARTIPVIDYARIYTPDLAAWLTKFAEGAANYDANGHFARVQPLFANTRFTDTAAGPRLIPLPATADRLAEFQGGNLKRCPGAAVQAAPDGSSPIAAEDCNPNARPPGP